MLFCILYREIFVTLRGFAIIWNIDMMMMRWRDKVTYICMHEELWRLQRM
jgi:hypothetical protein